MIVQEAVRTMLLAAKLAEAFWREAVAAFMYTFIRAQLRVNCDKTLYELWTGRSPSVRHFKNFGSKCYIKTNDDHLGKIQNKYDEGIFLGYSTERRDYKFYNN